MSTADFVLLGAGAGLLATPALLAAGRRLERIPTTTRSNYAGVITAAAVTAAAGGAAAAVQPTGALVALYALFLAAGTAASCTDLVERRLPDTITYPLIGAGLILALSSWSLGWPGNSPGGLIGGLVYSGWLLLCTLLVRAGAGYGLGDIKLATALGLLAGTHSTLAIAGTILAGQLLTIATMLIARARGHRSDVPLGPSLTTGAAVGILYATMFLS